LTIVLVRSYTIAAGTHPKWANARRWQSHHVAAFIEAALDE
jgi:hypothetical protein